MHFTISRKFVLLKSYILFLRGYPDKNAVSYRSRRPQYPYDISMSLAISTRSPHVYVMTGEARDIISVRSIFDIVRQKIHRGR